jgi:hypothetical protein
MLGCRNGWPAKGFPTALLRRPVSEIAFSETYDNQTYG